MLFLLGRRSILIAPWFLLLPLAVSIGCARTVDTVEPGAGEEPDGAAVLPGDPFAPGEAPGDGGTHSDGASSDAHASDHDAADATPPPPPPPPPPKETCTPLGADCVSGPPLEHCATYSSSGASCLSTSYKRGAQVYSCASCVDCKTGYEAAYVACQGATGSCAKLAACCSGMSATNKPSCQSAVATYGAQYLGELSCASLYDSYAQQGLCP